MAYPVVLVADDDEHIRHLVRLVLESEGVAVKEAGNGSEAIRLLHELRPAVLLLDLAMPGMSGLDAAVEIRRLQPEMPIVVFSATIPAEAEAFAKHIGAAATLAKPFDIDDLMIRLQPFLEAAAS